MKNSIFSILKARSFLPIFIVQLLGALNDNIFKNAVILFFTFQLAELLPWGLPTTIAIAASLFILPLFLFSAIAGQLADKSAKSALIRHLKLAELIIMSMGTAAFIFKAPLLLLVSLFLMGTQSAFFGPLKYGILPEYLNPEKLLLGNSWIEATRFLAIISGAVLAGIFMNASWGIFWVSTTLITIALAGWVVSRYLPATNPKDPTLKVDYNIANSTVRIIGEAFKQPQLFRVILGISWMWFVGAIWLLVLPDIVQQTFKGSEGMTTYCLALFSMGVAIGSIICSKIQSRELSAKHTPFAGAGLSAATILFVMICRDIDAPVQSLTELLSTTGLLVTINLLVIGAFLGAFIVPLYALIQVISNTSKRARMIAANNILNTFFIVLSGVTAASIYTFGGSSYELLVLTAGINLVVTLVIISIIPEPILHTCFRWILKKLFKVQVHGMSHLKKANKKTIIIANHASLIDALLITVFLPKQVYIAMNTHIAKKWWIKPLLWTVKTYPVDPSHPMGIKKMVEWVKQGKKIVIFPEGRITVTGALMKVYEGPGVIAHKADADILPIRIHGSQYSVFSYLKGKLPLQLFPQITINILPAQKFNLDPSLAGRDARRAYADKLYRMMVETVIATSNTDQTLFEGLLDSAHLHGMSTPILDDINFDPISYRQLLAKSLTLGKYMCRDTEKGDPVGLLIPNSKGAVVAFFGVQSQHRVCVMLNYSTGSHNLLSTCKTVKLKKVWTSKSFVAAAKLEPTIKLLKEEGLSVSYLEDFKDVKKHYMHWFVASYLMPKWTYRLMSGKHQVGVGKDSSVILFTSGSSGEPKGVVLSHENINANRYQMISVVDFNKRDKAFNIAPIFHSLGLTAGTLMPLLSGFSLFMYPSPLHYGIIPELIYSTNATVIFATNTLLQGYAKRAANYDFYSIRFIFAGGEKLQETTRRLYADKFGVRILQGYGVTETSPVIAFNTPMYNKIGSVGQIMPGLEYRLDPVEGIDNGYKLLVRGPNIMKGYILPSQPGILHPPKGGWHDTGDVVRLDEEGFMYIVGRVKRFAKIGGEMVPLSTLEELISHKWPEAFHACVSIPNLAKGEAIVLVTEKEKPNLKELREYIKKQGYSEIYVPKVIHSTLSIPCLGAGKPDYVNLEQEMAKIYHSKLNV